VELAAPEMRVQLSQRMHSLRGARIPRAWLGFRGAGTGQTCLSCSRRKQTIPDHLEFRQRGLSWLGRDKGKRTTSGLHHRLELCVVAARWMLPKSSQFVSQIKFAFIRRIWAKIKLCCPLRKFCLRTNPLRSPQNLVNKRIGDFRPIFVYLSLSSGPLSVKCFGCDHDVLGFEQRNVIRVLLTIPTREAFGAT